MLQTKVDSVKYIDLMDKLFSEYVKCIIDEVKCRTNHKKKFTILFYHVQTASRYYATGSVRERQNKTKNGLRLVT